MKTTGGDIIRTGSRTAIKVNNRIDFGYEMNIRAVAASSRISGVTSWAASASAAALLMRRWWEGTGRCQTATGVGVVRDIDYSRSISFPDVPAWIAGIPACLFWNGLRLCHLALFVLNVTSLHAYGGVRQVIGLVFLSCTRSVPLFLCVVWTKMSTSYCYCSVLLIIASTVHSPTENCTGCSGGGREGRGAG